MTLPASHPRDPLHGITLESILNQLVQRHGWGEMGRRIPIRSFQFNLTVKSSLTFLRKPPWARKRVEDWFIGELGWIAQLAFPYSVASPTLTHFKPHGFLGARSSSKCGVVKVLMMQPLPVNLAKPPTAT